MLLCQIFSSQWEGMLGWQIHPNPILTTCQSQLMPSWREKWTPNPAKCHIFVRKREALINQQRRDCEAAVLNRGPYQLADEFQTLEISSQKWFLTNVKQRESALQKFWKAQLPSVQCGDTSVSASSQDLPSYSTERLPEVGGYIFSVQAEESGLAGVPLL